MIFTTRFDGAHPDQIITTVDPTRSITSLDGIIICK